MQCVIVPCVTSHIFSFASACEIKTFKEMPMTIPWFDGIWMKQRHCNSPIHRISFKASFTSDFSCLKLMHVISCPWSKLKIWKVGQSLRLVALACLYATSDVTYGALKSAAHNCRSAPKSCQSLDRKFGMLFINYVPVFSCVICCNFQASLKE